MRTVMYQEWRNLLFLHWKVTPEALRPRVPDSLEIDTFNGEAYFGLVLFTMRGIRLKFMPSLPFVSAFHEFNARTYVRHSSGSGVYFYSLDAANKLAVNVANSRFHLPYYHASMEHHFDGSEAYYRSSRLGGEARIEASATISGNVWHAQPGTLDHFLVERYRLFTAMQGKPVALQVEHDPYPLRTVTNVQLQQSLTLAGGIEVSGEPIAHFAEGVRVRIGGLEWL